VIEESAAVQELAGDFGWSDADDAPLVEIRSLLFVIATGTYFASLWLMSGLAPFGFVLAHVRRRGCADTDGVPVKQDAPSGNRR
jgi:hypothetical protein